MRTRQKRVAIDIWRSLGCRTTPLEHWSKRKPTVEPRWAKQQTKKLRPKLTKMNSSLRITVRHRSASLAMRTVTLVSEFSIRTSQPSKILIIKKMYNVRTFVTHELEIFFVRTHISIIWKCNMAKPIYVLHTRVWYLVSALFLIMKMCNVHFSFTFFQNLDSCISKCSKGWAGQFHLFLILGPRYSLYRW